MALCSATSQPSARGFCTSGVANVESHTTRAPTSCAAAAAAATSHTSIAGFVGLSSHSIAGRHRVMAAASAAASSIATSWCTSRPAPTSSPSRSLTPLYRWVGASTTPPAGTSSSAALTAPIPLAKTSARPPSSSPSTCSSASQVGLEVRA